MAADRTRTTEINAELPDLEPEDVAEALRCAAEAAVRRQMSFLIEHEPLARVLG